MWSHELASTIQQRGVPHPGEEEPTVEVNQMRCLSPAGLVPKSLEPQGPDFFSRATASANAVAVTFKTLK
jgi:hypothetical protein